MKPGYSLAQLEEALWARDGARVHAVIDAALVPGLPTRLQESGCDFDCLRPGLLNPIQAAQAAYIVQLKPDAPLLEWLLGEASKSFPGWGVLMISQRPLLAMREHARKLAEVSTPEGQRRPWRWWDHGLLEALLPSLSPAQRDQFFAPSQSLVAVSPTAWTWWSAENGLLRREVRRLMAGTAN